MGGVSAPCGINGGGPPELEKLSARWCSHRAVNWCWAGWESSLGCGLEALFLFYASLHGLLGLYNVTVIWFQALAS